MDLLLNKALQHLSSVGIAAGTLIYFLWGDSMWLDKYLPINGKPMVVFLIVAIVGVYELLQTGQRRINASIDKISVQLEVDRLKQRVNSIFDNLKNEKCINNQNTIQEINELKDTRDRLNVNSYTQAKLKHLCKSIQYVKR